MLSLLAIVIALLGIDLFALLDPRVAMRLPFVLAACALLVALLAPFAGLFGIPLPSQFLLLWLLIIPLALICAVACTLIGLIAQAQHALAPERRSGHSGPAHAGLRPRQIALLLPGALIAGVAVAEALPPARLFTAQVQGVETSTGTVAGNARYGATFAGSVHGDPGGILAASANYTPAFPGPGITNTIIGGSWSLSIYRDGRFQGTLFGPLAAGQVRWNPDVTEATMTARLEVSGGTGSYLGARGAATFSGNLVHLTYPPTVAGSIHLGLR